jgi:signal transduction histidine kinase
MMVATPALSDVPLLDHAADLATVLAAWQDATVRLEQTHVALHEEVSRLTRELEHKNRELARKNRLADLGQMAAHVAHEVRNHLVPLKLYVSMIRRRLASDAVGLENLQHLEGALLGMEAMVGDMLHFTADRDPALRSVRLDRLASDVCEGVRAQLAAQQVRVEFDLLDQAHAVGDEGMLRRAVLNLVLNALDAMPSGGTLWISAFQSQGALHLEVADSGPGLSDHARRHAFEPFFTTKSSGTGLGLAIVDRIAQAHHGSVTATNCPEGGAAFTIHLPQ